ncbi:MAG: SpoIIE family protein phosphatase [Candidatus Dormibacteria bacterium]
MDAMASMSQLRSALAIAALASSDPVDVVVLVERSSATVPGAACATLAYGVLDRQAQTLRYTCAGHPYPLLVLPDGATQLLTGGRRPFRPRARSATSGSVPPAEFRRGRCWSSTPMA